MDELDELYRSRFDVFTRVAASVMGDSERARDAVQEAFATAVRKRRSFRGDGPLEAWVWRIVLNAAHSDVRRAVPAVDYDEPLRRTATLRTMLSFVSRSRVCRSGNGPPSSSATTPTSTTWRGSTSETATALFFGTWKVVRGTGQYAGIVGKGRNGHAGLGSPWYARYEDFLTTP